MSRSTRSSSAPPIPDASFSWGDDFTAKAPAPPPPPPTSRARASSAHFCSKFKSIDDVGKKIKSSKKRITWGLGLFSFNHEIRLIHSLMSGKKKVLIDGHEVHESQHNRLQTGEFEFSFRLNDTPMMIRIKDDLSGPRYFLYVEGVEFGDMVKGSVFEQGAPAPAPPPAPPTPGDGVIHLGGPSGSDVSDVGVSFRPTATRRASSAAFKPYSDEDSDEEDAAAAGGRSRASASADPFAAGGGGSGSGGAAFDPWASSAADAVVEEDEEEEEDPAAAVDAEPTFAPFADVYKDRSKPAASAGGDSEAPPPPPPPLEDRNMPYRDPDFVPSPMTKRGKKPAVTVSSLAAEEAKKGRTARSGSASISRLAAPKKRGTRRRSFTRGMTSGSMASPEERADARKTTSAAPASFDAFLAEAGMGGAPAAAPPAAPAAAAAAPAAAASFDPFAPVGGAAPAAPATATATAPPTAALAAFSISTPAGTAAVPPFASTPGVPAPAPAAPAPAGGDPWLSMPASRTTRAHSSPAPVMFDPFASLSAPAPAATPTPTPAPLAPASGAAAGGVDPFAGLGGTPRSRAGSAGGLWG